MTDSVSTRSELIRAGLEINDELPIDRLFAGVTTAAVAERAGVTTGSFFHHFRNSSEYAAAIVRSFDRERPTAGEVREMLSSTLPDSGMAEALSMVLADAWRVVSTEPAMLAERRSQMHLFAHHLATLPPDGTVSDDTVSDDTVSDDTVSDDTVSDGTVGDVLRDVYRLQIDSITSIWNDLLEITGMRVDKPFDVRRLAVAVHALILGLEILHQLDPDAVDDRLFAETTATLASAVSRLDLRAPVVVVAAELGQDLEASPQARSGARRRRESRQRVVEAATGMFADGWDSISTAEVAERADVSTQTVINLFGNVRRVCAATFGRHVPAFAAAIEAADRDRPREAIQAALLHLARAASEDPNPARALLSERVGARAARGFDLDDDDVRVFVPLGFRLTPPLASLTGWESTSLAVPDLGAALLDFVLGHATSRPLRSAETVEMAMRLIPAPGTPAPEFAEVGMGPEFTKPIDSGGWATSR